MATKYKSIRVTLEIDIDVFEDWTHEQIKSHTRSVMRDANFWREGTVGGPYEVIWNGNTLKSIEVKTNINEEL